MMNRRLSICATCCLALTLSACRKSETRASGPPTEQSKTAEPATGKPHDKPATTPKKQAVTAAPARSETKPPADSQAKPTPPTLAANAHDHSTTKPVESTPTKTRPAETPKAQDRTPSPAPVDLSEPGLEPRQEYRDDGTISREWMVKTLPDGTEVEHGPSRRWWSNGNIQFEEDFKDGVRHGKYNGWYEDGKRRGEGQFENGKKTGHWLRWDETGQLRMDYGYLDDLKHGLWKKWDPQGTLIEEGEYDRDMKQGTWIQYTPDGPVETHWVDGVQQP